MIIWRIIRPFDPWQSPLCTCPFKYTVNPYTGCGHGCLYCYASSYIKDFFRPRPKENILINVRKDLQSLPKGSVVELSASSDPFLLSEMILLKNLSLTLHRLA
jgi:DNA repair photolyase